MRHRLPSQASFRRIFVTALVFPMIAMAGKVELPDWEENDKPEEFALGIGLWPSGLLDNAISKADSKKVGDDKKAGKEAADPEKIAAAGDAPEKDPATGTAVGSTKVDDPEAAKNPELADPSAEKKAIRREILEIPPVLGPEVPERIEIEEPSLPPLIEITHVMPPIEGGLRDRFFKNRPKEFLIDPQQMLTEQKSNDVRRFLEYHAEEAGIDIYLIVMGNGQKIPEDISLASQHREWFGEIPTALVATTMGTMGNTQIVYGDQITGSVDKNAIDKVYQHCLREAQKIENDSDQIEQLALELSIQLYWVSQLLDKDSGTVSPITSNANGEIVATSRPDGAAMPIPFQNGASTTMGPLGIPLTWWILGSVALLALISAIWMVSWMWRRDSLNRKPVLFQELSMPSRLGGEFSGGGFVGMSYDVSGRE
ncbi:MAG: hypothetical protein ACKVJU_12590 [Verrucomicrobiales bacterium]